MDILSTINDYNYAHNGRLHIDLRNLEMAFDFALNSEAVERSLKKYESLIRQYGACTAQSRAVLKQLANEENRAIIEEGNLLHLGNCIQEEIAKQSSPDPSLTLSVEDMAKQLGIGRTKAYELVRNPGFPAIKVGKRTLVNRDELTKWLAEESGKEIGGDV